MKRGRLGTRVDFARLNHLFIPATKAGRDAFRESTAGRIAARVFAPVIYLYEALSPEGALFGLVAIIAGAFGLDALSTDTHIVGAALAAWVVASLVSARFYAMPGVRLEVVAARRVAVGEPLPFTLVVRNEGDHDHEALRFVGPFLPWDGAWASPRAGLKSLARGETARVSMAAAFRARGEHHLDPFRVAALVPLGLAVGASVSSHGCRFLVVPKVARVERLALPMRERARLGGMPVAAKAGASMDLLGLRPYRPGDAVRDLHARTSARIGTPVVREFQHEHARRIAVVVDVAREAGGRLVAEATCEAALSLAAGVVAWARRGDVHAELLVVGDVAYALAPRGAFTGAAGASGALERALDLLASVAPGADFDADGTHRALTPHLSVLGAVVVVAASWDDARSTMVARLRADGVAVTALVVDGPPSIEGGPVVVSSAAIVRDEPLVL